MTNITMERSTIFNGKIHYFDWAMFNSYFDITRGYHHLTPCNTPWESDQLIALPSNWVGQHIGWSFLALVLDVLFLLSLFRLRNQKGTCTRNDGAIVVINFWGNSFSRIWSWPKACQDTHAASSSGPLFSWATWLSSFPQGLGTRADLQEHLDLEGGEYSSPWHCQSRKNLLHVKEADAFWKTASSRLDDQLPLGTAELSMQVRAVGAGSSSNFLKHQMSWNILRLRTWNKNDTF